MRHFKPNHKKTRKPGGVYFQGVHYKSKWDVCKTFIRNNKIKDYYYENPSAKCVCGCEDRQYYNRSDDPDSKRYKRYMRQRNRKKYKLKPLVEYNEPKMVNHCVLSLNQKCHFCRQYCMRDDDAYFDGYWNPHMFGRILYFPQEKQKFCHECSQNYIKTIIVFKQLRKMITTVPYDCWDMIRSFLPKKKDGECVYKFRFIKNFKCASCGNFIKGSKGNRIKCSTALEILRRKGEYVNLI